jgi:hypothetical protein
MLRLRMLRISSGRRPAASAAASIRCRMAGISSTGMYPREGIQLSASPPVTASARGPKVPSHTGIGRVGLVPSRGHGRCSGVRPAYSAAWLAAAMIAAILLAWLRLLAMDGDLARAEPKTLRYWILHAAGRLVHGGGAES